MSVDLLEPSLALCFSWEISHLCLLNSKSLKTSSSIKTTKKLTFLASISFHILLIFFSKLALSVAGAKDGSK